MLLGRSFKTGPTMYKKKQTNKNEKSKDYCKVDSEERVLFFYNNIYIYISVRLAQRPQVWSSLYQQTDARTRKTSLTREARLTSPEVRAAATSKTRFRKILLISFSVKKRRLCSQGDLIRLFWFKLCISSTTRRLHQTLCLHRVWLCFVLLMLRLS